MTTEIPVDLWAYGIHRSLRPHQLEALGHPPAAELEGVEPTATAATVARHAAALDASAAAVADYLREAGGRGRHLVAMFMGRGRGQDLAPPLVELGPGLEDLLAVVEHLAGRQLGGPPVPAPPRVPGHLVKAHPIPCHVCGARTWSATPSRATSQILSMETTKAVEDGGALHLCQGL